MGGLISKYFHDDEKPAEVKSNISHSKVIMDDPRSPTEGVQRTPITFERKPYLETDIDQLTPQPSLRIKLLKNAFDPRSPTEGINRTPISLLESSNKFQEFDSPISLYSNNQPEMESYSCLASPNEPSVNVSDFDSSTFAKELDSLVDVLKTSFSDSEPTTPHQHRKLRLLPGSVEDTENSDSESSTPELQSHLNLTPAYLLDDEPKKISEDLVKEIIESFKECEEELFAVSRPKLKLSVRKSNAPKDIVKTPQLKVTKGRKPLSNITSSAGNTPTKLSLKKDIKNIRVESTGENSPIINSKVRAQWDHESTVII